MKPKAQETEKIVDLVARLVERGETERAELMADVARRREAGTDPATTPEGIDWRAFAVYFAEQHPRLTMFAPVALACYVWLFFDLILGG